MLRAIEFVQDLSNFRSKYCFDYRKLSIVLRPLLFLQRSEIEWDGLVGFLLAWGRQRTKGSPL